MTIRFLAKKFFLFSLPIFYIPAALLCSFNNYLPEELLLEDINHLARHISFLYQLNSRNSSLSSKVALSFSASSYDAGLMRVAPNTRRSENRFNHPLIYNCIHLIEEHKDLSPLFDAWNNFTLYYGLNSNADKIFIKECCQIVFIIYNKSLCYMTHSEQCFNNFRVDLATVRDLYVIIANLPIGRMLILLDKIAVGLNTAVTTNTTKPLQENLFGWIEKNWWIPPTILAGVITSIVLGKNNTTFSI